MSTGLAVFDTTVQETNGLLKAVQARVPPCSRQEAYGALRAELRARPPARAFSSASPRRSTVGREEYIRGPALSVATPRGAGDAVFAA